MPGLPRRDIVASNEVGLYHCYSRCVRRAYLCGDDDYTGVNYDHRKDWIERRLEFLASAMAVEVAVHAVMDNHFHIILRIRPDLAENWSDREVATRWLTLCSGKREKDTAAPPKPTQQQIEELIADKESLVERRTRLCSLSWMMKFLNEHIARRANAEDGVKGCFFEKRFDSIQLLDVWSLLLCAMYVDLNLIRAGKAETPEASTHTSAYRRILAWRAHRSKPGSHRSDQLAAAWLTPIEEGTCPPDGPQAEEGRRASDDGFLPYSVDQYFQLLDWSGRQVRLGKPGKIPEICAPILERLEVAPTTWLHGVEHFRDLYGNIAGQPERLREHALKNGRRWYRGVGWSPR